ncbi:hypothetical protein TeGR_g3642 [Tetraparma gracilis]|uniref:Uncharacterized protein n=1 Tax=Tetraparma gracilis TaxID=2962635 RepID=A0ABQ6MXF4_9STRA|nr:hypothetical protein TeGR_g3642 [Tetraparma gracilis]
MYCAPGLVETLSSIAADDLHELQLQCKELLSKITPDAAILPPPPPLLPPPLAPAATAPATAADMQEMNRRLDDMPSTAALEKLVGESSKLGRENSDLRCENAELRARLASVEKIVSGSGSSFVDLTRGDGASVTPTPGKRSALSLIAEERETVKKIKTEKAALKDDLEGTQDDYQLQITHTHNQETEIDALKARIRELERH